TRAESALRIAMVRPALLQPQESNPAVIFHDDFAQAPKTPPYFEYVDEKGSFVWKAEGGLGRTPGVMLCQFEKGQVSAGSLKVLFGKNPFNNKELKRTESFPEIYWRVYVRHEPGWQGNPAKLGRATCLASA